MGELVGDLKDTVGEGDLTAEKVHGLALKPELVEAVRARVEDGLLAYVEGRSQARRAVENSREQRQRRTS